MPIALPYTHPTLRNIAPELRSGEKGARALDTLALELLDAYERDLRDRSEWERMHADWVDMYYQRDEPQGTGGSYQMARDSLPLLTETCQRWHERAYGAMFADRRLVRALPTGRASPALMERAERLSMHMTWQLTVQQRAYKRTIDQMLLHLPIHGTAFLKTYRDPARGRNSTDLVRATDLIVPYGVGPRRLEDIQRKIQRCWLTANDAALALHAGWVDAPSRSIDGAASEHMSEPDKRAEEAEGLANGDNDADRPLLWLECHVLHDFDGDGLAEPYVVTVDVGSRQVVRVCIRWETDEAGNPAEAAWPDYKRPFEYFTAFHFIENPDGFYGLGMGHLLGQINKAANRLLRVIEDAGTLSTFGRMSGFISQALNGPSGGDVQLEMGKFVKVSGSTDDINKSFKVFDFKGPDPVLEKVLGILLQRSDRLGLTTEAVTGQIDKVMQPTTVLALLEESNRSFSAVNARVVDAWTDELEKHYRLNRTHLDPVEYFSVLGADGAVASGEIARSDYAPDMLVQPTVDPQMRSEKDRLQRAQMEYQTLAANPLVLQSPIHFYNTTKRFLRALRTENVEEVLPNPALMLPAQLIALQASLAGMGKDESGLPENSNGQQPAPDQGAPGMANPPGMGMAAGAGGTSLPPGGGALGGQSGGGAPGAGAAAGSAMAG